MVVLYVPSQAINQGGLSSQSDMPDMDEARGNTTLSFFFFWLNYVICDANFMGYFVEFF